MQFLIQSAFFVAFLEFLHSNPVGVVSSDLPLNLYLIKNVEDIVFFLVLKCSDKILLFLLKQKCASHFTKKSLLKIIHFYREGGGSRILGYCCESNMSL